jgi:hypothetical protein
MLGLAEYRSRTRSAPTTKILTTLAGCQEVGKSLLAIAVGMTAKGHALQP